MLLKLNIKHTKRKKNTSHNLKLTPFPMKHYSFINFISFNVLWNTKWSQSFDEWIKWKEKNFYAVFQFVVFLRNVRWKSTRSYPQQNEISFESSEIFCGLKRVLKSNWNCFCIRNISRTKIRLFKPSELIRIAVKTKATIDNDTILGQCAR